MKLWLCCLLSVLFGCCAGYELTEDNTIKLVSHANRRTVSIETKGGICSGFLVESDIVVTALHCVEKRKDLLVKVNKKQYEADRIFWMSDLDVAIIKTSEPIKDILVSSLATSASHLGQRVCISGRGMALKRMAVCGMVAAREVKLSSVRILGTQNRNLFDLIQAPIKQGHSGAAVYDSSGRVIGLVSLGTCGFSWIIRAKEISEVLGASGMVDNAVRGQN